MKLVEGQEAPDFTLLDEKEEPHTLSAYRGKPVVIFFYPRDDTPGCTKEACNFRDDYSAYEKAGAVILGISADDSKSHAKFINKFSLPFTLLADTEKTVVNDYDVWGLKKFMGKEYEGIFRTTFLIDGAGKIARIFENVKPEPHSQEVLDALAAL